MIDWATIEPGLLALAKSLSGLDVAAWFDQQRPMVPGNANGILLLQHISTVAYGSGMDSAMVPNPADTLAGTVALVNGSPNVTFSQAQTIDAIGSTLAFDSQPNVPYTLASDVSGTAAVLSEPYSGPNAPAAVTSLSLDLLYENLTEADYVTIRARVECYDQRGGRTARRYLEAMRVRWWRLTTDIALTPIGIGFVDMSATQDLSVPRDSHAVSIAAADLTFMVITTDTDTTGQPPIDSLEVTPIVS